MNDVVRRLANGLIVSCQVDEAALDAGTEFIRSLAIAAYLGGGVGVRINGADNVRAVKNAVSIPVIGIIKQEYPGSSVYITPTRSEIDRLIEAGADIVALDATDRERPDGSRPMDLIDQIHRAGKIAMADISTFEEGVRAAEYGADLVATTLSGYTESSRLTEGPDLELIRRLSEALEVPIIAEGRIRFPEEARNALLSGAYAVVVGTAITNVTAITKDFASAVAPTPS